MDFTNKKLAELFQNSSAEVVVIGAGLAGSECAWQLAERGHRVALLEQRPLKKSKAHTGAQFAELVCSNSLKSLDPSSAPGFLKEELKNLDSLILSCAFKAQVPAGQALAVDREQFSTAVTAALSSHPLVEIHQVSVESIDDLRDPQTQNFSLPIVIATGPLTEESLAQSLKPLIGDQLYFYDAIAPIIAGDSINKEIAFAQNRNDKSLCGPSDGDYLNCPFNQEQYFQFLEALGGAEKVPFHEFEKPIYFQGCQPIEALLERGPMTLAFGPMKPVGLTDPKTGGKPFAVVQLRKEDSEGRAWNLVGFQTKLKYPEQKKVFSMIPGLESAEFYRFGSLHRNTYIHSPLVLDSNFQLKKEKNIYFAGQITGVEGYLESCAIGALVARLLCLKLESGQTAEQQKEFPLPPASTAIGSLAHALVFGKAKNFQPLNMNWGLVPLEGIAENDKQKKEKFVTRGRRHFKHWIALFGNSKTGFGQDLQIEANPDVSLNDGVTGTA